MFVRPVLGFPQHFNDFLVNFNFIFRYRLHQYPFHFHHCSSPSPATTIEKDFRFADLAHRLITFQSGGTALYEAHSGITKVENMVDEPLE